MTPTDKDYLIKLYDNMCNVIFTKRDLILKSWSKNYPLVQEETKRKKEKNYG